MSAPAIRMSTPVSFDDVDATGIIIGSTRRHPPMQAQVDCCRKFIRERCVKRRTINMRQNSYALKHVVEQWTRTTGENYQQIDDWGRAWSGDYHYVSNGSFIVAALLEGYRVEPIDGTPYARLGLEVLP